MTDAIMVVTTPAVPPILRLLPGTYTQRLNIRTPTSTPIRIVATGAKVVPGEGTSAAIIVDTGAKIDVRGISVNFSKAMSCGQSAVGQSSVVLRDSLIELVGNDSGIEAARCDVSFVGTEIVLNAAEIAVAASGDDVSLTLVRAHLHGSNSHHIFGGGKRFRIQITDSLLEDVGFDLNTTDTSQPGSQLTVANSSLVYVTDTFLGQGCDQTANLTTRYENSIIASLGTFDSLRPTTNSVCTFANTLLSRQSNNPSGTILADPQFIAPSTRDFHLLSTSPAIDAAIPSTLGLDSTVDLDGLARPQGAGNDIGSYEAGQ